MLRNSIKKLGGKRSNAQTHRIRKKSRKTRRFGGNTPTKNKTTLMSKIKNYFTSNFKNKSQKLYNDKNKNVLTNFEQNSIALKNFNSKIDNKESLLYEDNENKKPPPNNRYPQLLKEKEHPIPRSLNHLLGPNSPS